MKCSEGISLFHVYEIIGFVLHTQAKVFQHLQDLNKAPVSSDSCANGSFPSIPARRSPETRAAPAHKLDVEDVGEHL